MSRAIVTARSVLWNHLGRSVEFVFIYATSVLIAWGLGVESNGKFVGILSISHLLLALTSFGLEASLNKHLPQLPENGVHESIRFLLRRVIGIRGVLMLASGGILYFLAVFNVVLLEPQLLWLVVGYAFARGFVLLLTMVFTARLETRITALTNTGVRALECVGMLMLVITGMTVESTLLFLTMTGLCHTALYGFLLRRELFGPARFVAMAPMLSFGGIFWINTIIDYVLGRQGDVLLLATLLNDPSHASLYDVAFSITQLALMGMTVGFGGIAFATFARLAVESKVTMDRFYMFLVRIMSLLTIPLFAFFFFNSIPFLQTFYHESFLEAATLVQGMMMFRIMSRLFAGPENAEYLLSKGAVWTVVGIGALGAGINIGGNFLLIPTMGAMGAVVASGGANVLVNGLGAVAVLRRSTVSIQMREWSVLAMVSIVVSGVVSLISVGSAPGTLVLRVVTFGILLVTTLVVTKPLHHADLEWISRIDERLRKPLGRLVRPA